MNKMTAFATTLISASLLAVAFGAPVFADGKCTNQYGGEVPCPSINLTINKQVQDPENGEYVENVTTAKFSKDDRVNFKLIVHNSSGETFRNVKITDTVPENVLIEDADIDYTDSEGKKVYTVSDDKKSVEFRVDQLPAGKTVTAFIFAKLTGPYPAEDQFCRDNWAHVTADERPDGDKNFARFCVASRVEGADKLPVAGVADLVYLLPFAATGLGGIALLRKRPELAEGKKRS